MNAFRRLVARIYDGSIVIGRRTRAWPWENREWRSTYGRLGWLGFCGWAWWRMVSAFPSLMALSVAVFLVAAFRASVRAVEKGVGLPDADAAEDGQVQDGGEDEEPPRATPAEVRAWLLPIIRARIGDGRGVHLDDLLAELVARGVIPAGRRVTELRAELERYGIPVRDQLKIGRVNRMGVHVEDLAAVGGGEAAATPPAPSDTLDAG